MKIHSRHVGGRTHPFTITVDPRISMNYAACVGDNNPAYFDDRHDGGAIFNPMACMALTWPLSVDFYGYWDLSTFKEDFPVDALNRRVHYTETIVWTRMPMPGESLVIQGSVAAILPHRAGSHLLIRYDAHDTQGAPVFTECIGALLRRVRCEDDGAGQEAVPIHPDKPEVDQPVWTFPLQTDPLAAHIYDGCTNMHFPIHTSVRFARSVGLKGTLLQGAATMSMAVRELINREADGDPTRLARIDCAFTGMVYPGDAIVIRLLTRRESEHGSELFFDVLNAEGKPAVEGGYLLLKTS